MRASSTNRAGDQGRVRAGGADRAGDRVSNFPRDQGRVKTVGAGRAKRRRESRPGRAGPMPSRAVTFRGRGQTEV